MKRALIILLVLGGTIGLSVAGYWYAGPDSEPKPLADDPNVEIVPVERRSLSDVVNATGTIEPRAEVELNFEISGLVAEVLVKQGQSVSPGTVLARLDTSNLELALRRAEIELAQKEADLQKLFEPAAVAQIEASQAKIESARLALAELLNDPNQADELAKAAASLATQQIALQEAQWAYDQVAYRGDVGAMGQANELQQATLDYEAALADYNISVRGSTDAEVAQARATLADASANLADLLAGPSQAEIASQQATIDLARISLEERQRDLEQAVLIAPTGGVVQEVTIEPGERVLQDAQNAALLLADTSAYLLKVQVDEIDIGRIKPGQPVNLVLDAFAEQEFAGQVVDVAPRPVAGENNAIVTYEVTIAVDTSQGDPGLLSGMTATANIEIRRLEAVMVVPNRAINIERETESPMIYVEKLGEDGQLMRVEVELGLRDNQVTEIVAGLEAGDQIIIRSQPQIEFGPST
ncbi:MAG: HlyD family efflux transporter periplasmic adaptor subunit [Anaerolineae bacterium]|nr:HlyD family efflux transporter periplasmic adaptor subunit [Anaerolineae bacterium]